MRGRKPTNAEMARHHLPGLRGDGVPSPDRKSTRLNSSHGYISYAVYRLKKKKETEPAEVDQPHPHSATVVRVDRAAAVDQPHAQLSRLAAPHPPLPALALLDLLRNAARY